MPVLVSAQEREDLFPCPVRLHDRAKASDGWDCAYWKEELKYDCLSVWFAHRTQRWKTAACSSYPEARAGVLPHHTIGHDPRIHGIEVDEVDVSAAVPCPVRAVGATIHHCRTLHYSGPNRTCDTRRAYIHTWVARTRSGKWRAISPGNGAGGHPVTSGAAKPGLCRSRRGGSRTEAGDSLPGRQERRCSWPKVRGTFRRFCDPKGLPAGQGAISAAVQTEVLPELEHSQFSYTLVQNKV